MNIAVCDDERFYVESIKRKIDNLQDTQDITLHCDGFTSADKFVESFYEVQYDLVYLDIELREANGIDIAELIHNIKPSTMIIFISSYTEYMNPTFGVKAFQFLKKPLNEVYFFSELQRAIREYRHLKKAFVFPTNNGNHIFHMDDILYIETSYNEYRIHTLDRSYYGNIKQVQPIKEVIVEFAFYRIQRSFIVNLRHIVKYDKNTVTMINGDILNISRTKYKDFQKQLLRFLDS